MAHEASIQEQAAVAVMCSVAVLLVAALASVGAIADAAAWWKVTLLLPWYLLQGLFVVATALT
jgi:uncharacterized protein (DUF983 family)